MTDDDCQRLRAVVDARDNPGRTHWDGCYIDPTHRDCAIVRLLAERDRLAAENKEIRLHNEKLAEDFAHSANEYRELCKVFDERDRLAIELEQANNTAATACKRFAEVSAELAELRAACSPFAKWWQEAVNNIAPNALENAARRPIAYDGLHHGPTLGDCRRIADMLARTPEEGGVARV